MSMLFYSRYLSLQYLRTFFTLSRAFISPAALSPHSANRLMPLSVLNKCWHKELLVMIKSLAQHTVDEIDLTSVTRAQSKNIGPEHNSCSTHISIPVIFECKNKIPVLRTCTEKWFAPRVKAKHQSYHPTSSRKNFHISLPCAALDIGK